MAEVTTAVTNDDRINQIEKMYNASLESNKANLESQYQQSLSNAQADKQAIAQNYQQQQAQTAADYERQRRNMNLQGQVAGLNTGTGSQMALSQQANYQSNAAQLRQAQAQEENAANRAISDLTTQYQIAVNQAIAENDYQKSAALLDEYNNQREYLLQQANNLAQYGDFSSYAGLGYTPEQIATMQNKYNTGLSEEKAALLAQYGDFSGYKALGYTDDQIKQMGYSYNLAENTTKANNLAQYGDYSGYSTLGYTPEQIAAMQTKYTQTQDAEKASTLAQYGDFSTYKNLGYTDEQIANMNTAYNLSTKTQDAATKAQYGDFSGYADMYGQDTANTMQKVWALQNPGTAYVMGYITAAEYKTITGQDPPGTSSGGGSWSGWTPTDDTTKKDDKTTTDTPTTTTSRTVTSGDLLEAAAAGYNSSQIRQALNDIGVNTAGDAITADIKWARSK